MCYTQNRLLATHRQTFYTFVIKKLFLFDFLEKNSLACSTNSVLAPKAKAQHHV
jgi:hypothetical protein